MLVIVVVIVAFVDVVSIIFAVLDRLTAAETTSESDRERRVT